MEYKYLLFGWDGYYPNPAPQALVGGFVDRISLDHLLDHLLKSEQWPDDGSETANWFENYEILDLSDLTWETIERRKL